MRKENVDFNHCGDAISRQRLKIREVWLLMETIKNGVLNLFDKLIETAPPIGTSTMCWGAWGEPDYPSEDE